MRALSGRAQDYDTAPNLADIQKSACKVTHQIVQKTSNPRENCTLKYSVLSIPPPTVLRLPRLPPSKKGWTCFLYIPVPCPVIDYGMSTPIVVYTGHWDRFATQTRAGPRPQSVRSKMPRGYHLRLVIHVALSRARPKQYAPHINSVPRDSYYRATNANPWGDTHHDKWERFGSSNAIEQVGRCNVDNKR